MSAVSGQPHWIMPGDNNIWKMQLDKATCLQDLKEQYKGSTLFARIQRLFFWCVICCSKLTYAEWHGIQPVWVAHDKIARKVERLFQEVVSQLVKEQYDIEHFDISSSSKALERAEKWRSKAMDLLNRYDLDDQTKKNFLSKKLDEIMNEEAIHSINPKANTHVETQVSLMKSLIGT